MDSRGSKGYKCNTLKRMSRYQDIKMSRCDIQDEGKLRLSWVIWALSEVPWSTGTYFSCFCICLKTNIKDTGRKWKLEHQHHWCISPLHWLSSSALTLTLTNFAMFQDFQNKRCLNKDFHSSEQDYLCTERKRKQVYSQNASKSKCKLLILT